MSSAPDIPPTAARLGIVGIAIVIFSLAYQYAGWTFLNTPSTGGVPNTIGTYYKVTGVSDGDTIRISTDSGEERIRLIGINTPETAHPTEDVQCFGKEASERMEDLVEGEIVRLEYDDTQGYRDTYGRMLAYVYLEDGQMVNRKMLAEGYAYEYTYMYPYRYQKEFRELQNVARSAGRGLWSPDTCNGKKSLFK
jgi:micrococcal nuclease